MTARLVSHRYRTPPDLEQSDTGLRRVLVIGSCLIAGLPGVIKSQMPDVECDYLAANNLQQLPAAPPNHHDAYEFQFIQLAVRSILPDATYLRLDGETEAAYGNLLQETKQRLGLLLETTLLYNTAYGMLTFVSNFLIPQINPLGRLLPRYELRNMIHFFEELNRSLSSQVSARPNCYIVDTDQIAASIGKRYIQDDVLCQINHASALSDADHDLDQLRLQPVLPASVTYEIKVWEFMLSIWYETVSMYRTIKRLDAVKLVIIDLDDTLWRGVLAEEGRRSPEGWPLGLAEALLYLKKRGVILAIASKNDSAFIEEVFDSIFGRGRICFDDFAIKRINWRPKADNILEMIAEVNVLPDSVVFIDDNPIERAAVSEAITGIRTLGSNLYTIRRALLWSAEAQTAEITSESSRRTEMIVAKIERDSLRAEISRSDFLFTLNIRVVPKLVASTSDECFARVSELVNKTNQFNTTGKRWSFQDWGAALAAGTVVYAFEVDDKFTEYGIVAVVVVSTTVIQQFVLSCRVFGLDVEEAIISTVITNLGATGAKTVSAMLIETESNSPCRDIFRKTDFRLENSIWYKETSAVIDVPKHIVVDTSFL